MTGQDGSYLAKLLLERDTLFMGLPEYLEINSLNLRYLGIESDINLIELEQPTKILKVLKSKAYRGI